MSSNCGFKNCLERWGEAAGGDQRTARCYSHILSQGQKAMRNWRTTLNESAFYLKTNIHHLGCYSPTYVLSIPRRGGGTTLSKRHYSVRRTATAQLRDPAVVFVPGSAKIIALTKESVEILKAFNYLVCRR